MPRTPSEVTRRLSTRDALRALLRDRSVRAACFAFAVSRAVVLVVFALTPLLHVKTSPDGVSADTFLSLRGAPVARELRRSVLTADANWYVGIAESGYDELPFSADVPRNWAFFPLYPLLLRAASLFTGELVETGMALSNLFFLLALVVLYKTAGAFGLDEEACDRTVFYVAVFPSSYFFSLPFTEALFLLVSVGSFYAARRGHWLTAGALGALASATRVTGVLLLPALLALHWQQRRRVLPRAADALGLLLVPAGLLSFMLYLYLITGDALAFKDIQPAWGRHPSWFWQPLLDFLISPADLIAPWDFRVLNFAAAAAAFACGFAWLRRREWALGIYTLLSVVFTLSSGLLQSQARFVSVVFPVFMWLALAGRAPRFDQAIRAVFLALLGLLAALFAAHFNFTMS
jgi:hypothetical protein